MEFFCSRIRLYALPGTPRATLKTVCTNRKGIVTCMNKWHQYLYGKQHITLHTDHQPLELIFKKPISKALRGLQRMMLKLLDYQFKVTYKNGKELHVADTSSRAALKDSFESRQSDVFCMELVEMDLKPSNVTADTLEII